MAVTVTPVHAGSDFKTWDIIASADADTTATIAHGMAEAPRDVTIRPLLDAAHESRWFVSTADTTNVVLTKGTAVGSGNASAQIRVQVRRPHSLGA